MLFRSAGGYAIFLFPPDSGHVQAALPACQEADEFCASFESLTGVCYFRKGAFKAAVEAYSRAIAKAPLTRAGYGTPAIKKALVFTNRAEAWVALGNFDRAIEDCDSALGVDAQDTYAQRLRTEAQRERDKHRHSSL